MVVIIIFSLWINHLVHVESHESFLNCQETILLSECAPVGGGVSGNRMGPLNTGEGKFTKEHAKVLRNAETKNLRKSIFASKVVNPFTRALGHPFIRRRRDFYILRLPSNLKNISGMNTYMNVFYIPGFVELILHIYKSATSSHF
jgi:hypothetical protein